MQKKLVNILKIVHKKICDPTKKNLFVNILQIVHKKI